MAAQRVKGDGRILRRPINVLVVDVGGTNVKLLATGKRGPRKARSGPSMTAAGMVEAV
jgi:hypothetical protein